MRLIRSARTSYRADRWIGGTIAALFALLLGLTWIAAAFALVATNSIWLLLMFGVVGLFVIPFKHLLKAPTRKGRITIDHLDGFRHYLGVAEAERLDLENPPDRTPAVFEQFLPYALALGVEQRWSAQFAEVLASANYEPNWCVGDDYRTLGAVGMATALGTGFSSAIASASTAPGSSSGSGGGGSSGGGGGGW